MTPRFALVVLLLGLGGCAPTVAPVESNRIERGTALPPPGLATAAEPRSAPAPTRR